MRSDSNTNNSGCRNRRWALTVQCTPNTAFGVSESDGNARCESAIADREHSDAATDGELPGATAGCHGNTCDVVAVAEQVVSRLLTASQRRTAAGKCQSGDDHPSEREFQESL
jgi:hypothetical protein